MEKQWRGLVVIALALTVVGCSPSVAPVPPTQSPSAMPTAQAKTPEAVLRAVTDALNGKDVETATTFLADDVTQTLIPAPSGTGVYNGKDAMRARFKEVVAGNAVHKLTNCQTGGDKVTCAATYSDDSTKPLGFDLEMKAEAVVQNGLLKTVTWKMTDASLAKMQAAMANAQPQPMAVTFAGGTCTMDGPQKVLAGTLATDWNVVDKDSGGVLGLCVVILDAGKTIDDLNAAPGYPQPSWVRVVACWSNPEGSRKTVSTEVKQSPIYFVCFSSYTTKIGALGPIKVGK